MARRAAERGCGVQGHWKEGGQADEWVETPVGGVKGLLGSLRLSADASEGIVGVAVVGFHRVPVDRKTPELWP